MGSSLGFFSRLFNLGFFSPGKYPGSKTHGTAKRILLYIYISEYTARRETSRDLR